MWSKGGQEARNSKRRGKFFGYGEKRHKKWEYPKMKKERERK